MQALFRILQKQLVIKIPFWMFATLPFLAYLGWEYHWYTVLGLGFIKWHTHLAVYVYLWLAGAGLYSWVNRAGRSVRATNYFLSFTSVVTVLFLFEAYLVLGDKDKNFHERIYEGYVSPYLPSLKSHYFSRAGVKLPYHNQKTEFSYLWLTNRHGFNDVNWPVAKTPGEKRILTLGDSFTEGDGAPSDSCYPSILRNLLFTQTDSCYVMNAGVCGSDPFFNYVWLRDSLIIYQPDVVIQTLSDNDFTVDYAVRGGMERFKPDGTLQYRKPPWWEPLFAISNISRYFFLLITDTDFLNSKQIADINQAYANLFDRYATYCHEQHIRLCVVVFPYKGEIENNRYDFDMRLILAHLKANPDMEVYDLLPLYRAHFAATGESTDSYYWNYDNHPNAKGYRLMAELINRCVFN